MSYWKSLSALLTAALIIGCVGKQKETEKAGGPSSATKDTLSISTLDTIPSSTIYASADFGLSWQPMSTGLPGNLQPACIDKVGQELILATENAGLFMTTNNKSAWKDISTGLATKKINTLYVAGDEIYIGLFHEGVTMWKLNSKYWNSYNSHLPNKNVLAIVKVKDELVIGTDMGIFKSSGQRQSWTGKHVGEKTVSLQIKGDTLYAGTVKGVMMSKDGGEHWVYVHKGGSMHAMTIQDKIIYALYTSGDLFRSDNWGRAWKAITYNPASHSSINTLIKADDNYLMSTSYGVFRSKNGAMDWKLIFPEQQHVFIDFVEEDHVVYAAARSGQ